MSMNKNSMSRLSLFAPLAIAMQMGCGGTSQTPDMGQPSQHSMDGGGVDASQLELRTVCYTLGEQPERCLYGDGFRILNHGRDPEGLRCGMITFTAGQFEYTHPCGGTGKTARAYRVEFCVASGTSSEVVEPMVAKLTLEKLPKECRFCPQPPRYECRSYTSGSAEAEIEDAEVSIGPAPVKLREGRASFSEFGKDCTQSKRTLGIKEPICEKVSLRFRLKT